LYYGTFLRTPGTDEVFSAAGVDNCHSCQHANHLPGLLHADVGIMFSFHHCDSITVRDVELNGNIDAAILGGRSADDGIQTEYDGIHLFESSNCVIENVDAHHFGRDGLQLWGTHTDTTDHFTDMYPDLYVGTDPADHSVTTPGNWTVLFNNQVLNSSFTWNGRQGISWTALAGLEVTDCDFNYNGAGRMTSQPGAGLDIEGAGGPIRVRHGIFDDCRFLHNRASGIVSAHAVCMGQRNFKFTRCLVKAGLEGAAIWPEAAQMVFDSCEVYGNVGELYEQPEDIARDTAFNLVFRNTNFYEEDDQWSYIKWFFEGHPQDCQYGPQMFRFVKPGSALASFEHCGFHTNCKAIVRFKGRSINDTGLQHCPIDSSGPCLSCTSPDDRYVRITDCVFVNTGRDHCPAFGNPAGTEVLSADFTTVDGLDIFIPATVRGGGVNDDYWTPMGSVTPGSDSMYVDTTMTYTTGAFPPCLPFYAHDTVAHWDMCDPANNVLVQACPNDANCYSERAISSGIHSSALGVGLSMTTVYIQGEFIIDNNFVIDQCIVRMGPGAEIIVTGGHVLEVVDSDLSACTIMWRSITVQDSAVVNVFNSTIADAQYGVKALDGSMVNAYNSSFKRNYVGIGVPDNAMGWNNTVVNVHGTTFSTGGPLAPPFAGQTPALGTKGFAGIEVHDMALLIYGWNSFSDLSNGIVADGCDLSVTECTFADIQPDAAYAHPANGSGIRAKGLYALLHQLPLGHLHRVHERLFGAEQHGERGHCLPRGPVGLSGCGHPEQHPRHALRWHRPALQRWGRAPAGGEQRDHLRHQPAAGPAHERLRGHPRGRRQYAEPQLGDQEQHDPLPHRLRHGAYGHPAHGMQRVRGRGQRIAHDRQRHQLQRHLFARLRALRGELQQRARGAERLPGPRPERHPQHHGRRPADQLQHGGPHQQRDPLQRMGLRYGCARQQFAQSQMALAPGLQRDHRRAGAEGEPLALTSAHWRNRCLV